jgi:hypothetical protein
MFLAPRVPILWPSENLRQICQYHFHFLDTNFVKANKIRTLGSKDLIMCQLTFRPLSAYKYHQNAEKVGIPIFKNFSLDDLSTSRGPPGGPNKFVDPKNHSNMHNMAKLELSNIKPFLGSFLAI